MHHSSQTSLKPAKKKEKNLTAADSQVRPSFRACKKEEGVGEEKKEALKSWRKAPYLRDGRWHSVQGEEPVLVVAWWAPCCIHWRVEFFSGNNCGKPEQMWSTKNERPRRRAGASPWSCGHTQYLTCKMPDGWLIETKPVVALEGSSGTWSEKRPPYLTVCARTLLTSLGVTLTTREGPTPRRPKESLRPQRERFNTRAIRRRTQRL